MTGTIPIGRLPGAPRLYLDYLGDFERVRDLFALDFRSAESFERATQAAAERSLPRDEVANVLLEQNLGFGGGESALGHIALLRERGTVAVVTGQQPGLFGGPLYTLHKAATAVRLAQRLQAVPVFWIANDDHHTTEVDHVHVVDSEGELARISWLHAAGEPVPVSTLGFDDGVADALAGLDRAAAGCRYREQTVELLATSYRPGARLTDAFARWLARLFEREGLVLVDPSDPRLRRLGMRRLAGELAFPSPTTEAARTATDVLEARGYPAQVRLRDDRLNLFCGQSDRFRVRCGPEGFQVEHRSGLLDAEELHRRFEAAPEQFAPNVLLRPLYQDALLPTVACVAGPSEIAYYAQLRPVYARFGLPMPVIYPRKSVTLVNAKARRLLGRLGLQLEDFLGGATRPLDGRVPEAFSALRTQLDAGVHALAEQLAELDPVLARRADAIARRALADLDALERRAGDAHLERDAQRQRQLTWLASYLLPDGQPQERVLGLVQGLLDAGPELVPTVVASLDLDDHDHQVVAAYAEEPVRA